MKTTVRQHRCDINRPRRRHTQKYSKWIFRIFLLDDVYVYQATHKQHLRLSSLKKLSNAGTELKKAVVY